MDSKSFKVLLKSSKTITVVAESMDKAIELAEKNNPDYEVYVALQISPNLWVKESQLKEI